MKTLTGYTTYTGKHSELWVGRTPRRNARGQYSSIRPLIFLILAVAVTIFIVLYKLLNAPLQSPCETNCFINPVRSFEGRFTTDTDPVIKAIHQNFDQISYEVGDQAVKIARCESTLNPRAVHVNKNGSVDRGLFQINSVHKYTADQLFDLDTNIKIAKKIYEKQGWNPWVCKKVSL